MNYLEKMTACELHAEVQKGNIGIEELTRFYLDRIDKYDVKLNTVSEINESAIKQARKMDSQTTGRDSILFGLPILVKDNIDVAGLHTTAGSLALSDNLVTRNAKIIENIIHNGGIILGKTNMTEFANFTTQGMPGGYSSKAGIVRHAYDENKNASGSSTGSAVAVSAGLCSMAVGTDTSFSIVGCATENGVTGFKPRHTSLSCEGIIPISHTLDSAGVLSKNLSDAILLYKGMSNKNNMHIQATAVNQLKIGINVFNRDKVSDAQLNEYSLLLTALRSEGAKLSEISQPTSPHLSTIMQCEFKSDLELYLKNSSTKIKTLNEIISYYEADPEEMMKYGISLLKTANQKSIADEEYKDAISKRSELSQLVINEIQSYDACIMTGPTNIMHLLGLPSLALKLCMGKDNMPKGIILYGADERRLLAAALEIEKYCRPVIPPQL